jgi:hypothetical protein
MFGLNVSHEVKLYTLGGPVGRGNADRGITARFCRMDVCEHFSSPPVCLLIVINPDIWKFCSHSVGTLKNPRN